MFRSVRAPLAAALACSALAGCAFTDPLITPSDRVVDLDGLYFVGETDGSLTFAVFELARTYRPREFGSPYVDYVQRGLVSQDGVWTRLYGEDWSEWEGDPETPATDLLQLVVTHDKAVDLYFSDEDAKTELRIRSEPLSAWTAPEEAGVRLATLSGPAALTYQGKKIHGWLLSARMHGIEETFHGFEATVVWDRRGNWWLAGAPGSLGRAGRLVAFSNSRGQAILVEEGAEIETEEAERDGEAEHVLRVRIPAIEFASRLLRKGVYSDFENPGGMKTADYLGRATFRGRERRVFGLRQAYDPDQP